MPTVTLRFYGPLNDFLAPAQRHRAWAYQFEGRTSVKDLIERFDVPHPEVDLVLVDDEPVGFDHAVREGQRIAVFPRFHSVDIAVVTRVRPPAPGEVRFVLDGHLGRLARYLRLLGFDTIYDAHALDHVLAATAAREHRILLTRDRGLLKRRSIDHGYVLRWSDPLLQAAEVLEHFGPVPTAPFTRCLTCNGLLREVAGADVAADIPPRTRHEHHEFLRCEACGKVFWKGSHWRRLTRVVRALCGPGDPDV